MTEYVTEQFTPQERATLEPFVRRHGVAALARVLFNSGEFMQVD